MHENRRDKMGWSVKRKRPDDTYNDLFRMSGRIKEKATDRTKNNRVFVVMGGAGGALQIKQ